MEDNNNKTKENKKSNAFILTVILLVFISVAVLFYLIINNNKNTNRNKEANTNTIIDETGSLEKEEPIFEPIKDVPVIEKNRKSDSEEIEKDMQRIYEIVNEFYIAYVDYTNFISKDGFLYDFPTKKYITEKSITEEQKIYFDNIYPIYLKEEDFNSLLGISEVAEDKFILCLATLMEDGFIIKYKKDKSVKVTEEEFYNVFNKYKTETSNVQGFQVLKNSEEFNMILKSLKEYTKIDKFDFRSISTDDRFSFVTASPHEEPNNIKQYILEKNNNSWNVVMDKIDETLKPYLEVNKKIPSFNLELMPEYSVRNFKDLMNDDIIPIVEAVKADEKYKISQDDELLFACGTDYFAYMEFASGARLIGSFTEEQFWMIYPVNSYEEGFILMLSIDERAPTFIIRQTY